MKLCTNTHLCTHAYTRTHTHIHTSTHAQIQGRNPSVLVTQDICEDLSDRFDESSVSVELPACELSKLDDIFELVTSAIPSTVQRESLALAIEKEGYIAKLIDLFHVCEDLENADGLHHLYNIFRTIFLLNKPSLLGMMFADDMVMDVIGCLEYDPAKPRPIRHREYLKKISQHREVIPFNNPNLLAKIHQVGSGFVLIIQGIRLSVTMTQWPCFILIQAVGGISFRGGGGGGGFPLPESYPPS